MSRNAMIIDTEIDASSVLPTWEDTFPRLFIKPNELYVDDFGVMEAVVVDNFFEAASTALTAHTSDAIDGVADMPWTARVSAMLVGAGNGNVQANPIGTPALQTKAFSSANIAIKSEITITAQTTEALIARYSGTTAYFRAALVGGVTNQLQLVRVNGSGTVIGSYTNAGTITSGSTHEVELKVNGNAFEVYLDGVLRISVSDSFNNTQVNHGIQLSQGTHRKFQAKLN